MHPSLTIPYHRIQNHIIPYHTTGYNTILYHTIPYHTIPLNTIPYYTLPYHTLPYHATEYNTIYHTTHQVVQTNLVETRATLSALARLHAHLWLGGSSSSTSSSPTSSSSTLAGELWPVGTYWDLAKQPRDQVSLLPELVDRAVREFGGEREEVEGVVEERKWGEVLARHASRLDREVHGGKPQVWFGVVGFEYMYNTVQILG